MWVPPYLAEMWEISREWRRSAHLSTPSRQRNLLTPTIQIEKAKTNWHTITTQTAKLEVERKSPPAMAGFRVFWRKAQPYMPDYWVPHVSQRHGIILPRLQYFLLTHVL